MRNTVPTSRAARAEKSRERMRARNVNPIGERASSSRAAIFENHLIQGGLSMRGFAPCNAVAPDADGGALTMCGVGGYCIKVVDHPGPHESEPSRCNRPAGHAGPHTVYAENAFVLARWPQ